MSSNSGKIFEQLEARQLFSAVIVNNAGEGIHNQLLVTGTSGADQITVVDVSRIILTNNSATIERDVVVTEQSSQGTHVSRFKAVDVSEIHVFGGAGDDTITMRSSIRCVAYGDTGNHGDIGNDVIDINSSGNTYIDAGDGNDVVSSTGSGNQTIIGGYDNDTITVNTSGTVLVLGDLGNDTITNNGSGPSTLQGDAGDDIIRGGSGPDLILGEHFVTNSDVQANNTSVTQATGNDIIFGNGGDDEIWGGLGADELHGGNGKDIIHGNGKFNDVLKDGDDKLFGDAGDDQLFGADGNDELHGGNNNDLLSGDGGVDKLFGESGDDLLMARDNVGSETVDGGAGFDRASIDNSPIFPVLGTRPVRDNVFNVESLI